MNALIETAWLIPVIPLLSAFVISAGYVIGFNRGERGEVFTSRVSQLAVLASLIMMLLLDFHAITSSVPGHIVFGEWMHSGDYRINFGFSLDVLGLTMGTLMALISFLTIRFSVNYMHREDGFQRFFIIMNLFTTAMLMIVLAGNAAFAFIGWELAGVSSFLLIGYALERPTATANANHAFITNRIGDVGFMIALISSLLWMGSVDWDQLAQGTAKTDILKLSLIVGGFIVAAMAKSAMVPFSGWIARALEGPTPSSAIFYGALMVHAGVVLLLRLQPVLEQTPAMMVVLVIIGALSVLYGFLGGLVQADVKTAFVFSTTAQVGLMFIECGLGLFELATVHLIAHAIWRAYQFLSAPSYIQLISRTARPVPTWLAKRPRLYNACLQRFWLDNIINAWFVRPIMTLAGEFNTFDKKVINHLVGLPASAHAISSLADWEARKRNNLSLTKDDIGEGKGLLGKFMEGIASMLQWFEEHLVLKGSGEGLLKTLQRIGTTLIKIDYLLSKPRYLWLIIMIAFVVVI